MTAVGVALVGAAGFVGHHLLDAACSAGAECFAVDVTRDPYVNSRASSYLVADARRVDVLGAFLASTRPDVVFHLAGRRDETDLGCMLDAQVGSTDALFRALGEINLEPIVVVAGSSAQYGSLTGVSRRLAETAPACPTSLYGVTKVAQESTAWVHARRLNLPVIVARLFNLVGPSQPGGFVVPDLVASATEAYRIGEGGLPLRAAKSVRDYVDVRDAAHALWLLGRRGRGGEAYNVCSGRPVRTVELARLVAHAVRPDSCEELAFVPSNDAPADWSVGDPTKIAEATGWSPIHDLRESVGAYVEGHGTRRL